MIKRPGKTTFNVKLFNLEDKKQAADFAKLMTESMDPKKKVKVYKTYFSKTFTQETRTEEGYTEKTSIQEQWVRCEIVSTVDPKERKKSF